MKLTSLLQLVNMSEQIYGVFGCEASFFHLTTQREIFRFLVFNEVKLIEKYEGKFRFAWEILPGGKRSQPEKI